MKTLLLLSALVPAIFIADVDTTLVDMTHKTNNQTLYFAGFFPFNLTSLQKGYNTVGDGSQVWFEYNMFTSPEHLGTHMDSPVHIADGPGYWTVDEIPVDHLIGPAVVIDITYKADVDTNPDAVLEVDDLIMWEERYGRIPDGAIVFCNSGWDQYWGDALKFMGNTENDPTNYHWPAFGEEAAKWLVDNRNIAGIGVDTLSLDHGITITYSVHVTVLSNNIYGLENVKNLGKIPPAGARVYVMPSNYEGASGVATRIVAEFDSIYLAGPYRKPTNKAENLKIHWLLFVVNIIIGFKCLMY